MGRTFVAVTLAVVGMLVLVGCTGAAPDRTGGTTAPGPLVLTGITTGGNGEIQPFIDGVQRLSNGAMTVRFIDGWNKHSVTGEADAINAVRSGAADYAVVPARAWHDAGVDSFDALVAPMTVDSYALQDTVLHSSLAGDMLAGVRKLGLIGIGIVPGPLRQFDGISRTVLTPAALLGAKVAVNPGGVAEHSLRSLGATPVRSPFDNSDISRVDAAEMQLGSVEGNVYDGVITSVTVNLAVEPRPLVIVGNAAAMATLNGQQQKILMTAATQSISAATVSQQKSEAGSVQLLCTRSRVEFLTASTSELALWKHAYAPTIAWLATDPATRGFLQRIGRLRDQTNPAPSSVQGCPANANKARPTASAPLDGAYQMITTAAEAEAFGLPLDGAVAANTGTFRWTFDHGTFTETQTNGATRTWANGTYVVVGDFLTMTYQDSGGSGPASDARAAPGADYTWKWSLYRNQLVIHWPDPTVPKTQYPANYAVKPWTRIDNSTPSTTIATATTAVDGSWAFTDTDTEFTAAHPERGEMGDPGQLGNIQPQLRPRHFSILNTKTAWRLMGGSPTTTDSHSTSATPEINSPTAGASTATPSPLKASPARSHPPRSSSNHGSEPPPKLDQQHPVPPPADDHTLPPGPPATRRQSNRTGAGFRSVNQPRRHGAK